MARWSRTLKNVELFIHDSWEQFSEIQGLHLQRTLHLALGIAILALQLRCLGQLPESIDDADILTSPLFTSIHRRIFLPLPALSLHYPSVHLQKPLIASPIPFPFLFNIESPLAVDHRSR